MNVSAVIFTYAMDAALAERAAKAAFRAGMTPLMVWDGAVPENAANRTPEALHIASDFPRRGNLNGEACVRGVLDIFAAVSDGADWVVKIDSDTIVRRSYTERLARSAKDSEGFYVLNTNTPWWGCCYALRAATAKRLAEIAKTWAFEGRCPEDHTIYQMMLRNGMTRGFGAIGWMRYGPKGHEIQPGADATHYGDIRDIPGPPFTVAFRKEYIAARMEEALQKL